MPDTVAPRLSKAGLQNASEYVTHTSFNDLAYVSRSFTCTASQVYLSLKLRLLSIPEIQNGFANARQIFLYIQAGDLSPLSATWSGAKLCLHELTLGVRADDRTTHVDYIGLFVIRRVFPEDHVLVKVSGTDKDTWNACFAYHSVHGVLSCMDGSLISFGKAAYPLGDRECYLRIALS